MYYAIVEKQTGKMQNGASNYHDDPSIPINTVELAHVPLNQELTDYLTHSDHDGLDIQPIDFEQTYWDFNQASWHIFYQTVTAAVNPVTEKITERQKLLDAANKKLQIPDLSVSARSTLEAYVAYLNSFDITAETAKDCIFDQLPI